MFRKILILCIVIFVFRSFVVANKRYVIDTPTTGVLNCGSYNMWVRCFSEGNIISKLEVGVFKFLDIGMSLELDKFIGDKKAIKAAVPALDIKLRLYGGSMAIPAMAVGYDGQGYFINSKSSYRQKEKGLYFVTGRELFIDGLMLNIGVNVNDFSKNKVCGFINAMIPVYKEAIYFMAEYDNINYSPDARFNCGLKFVLTDYIDVSCIIRNCWCGNEISGTRIQNERVFKVNYSGKF
jgi:hypothetical protein